MSDDQISFLIYFLANSLSDDPNDHRAANPPVRGTSTADCAHARRMSARLRMLADACDEAIDASEPRS